MNKDISFDQSFEECIFKFFNAYREWDSEKLEEFKNNMKCLYNYNYLNFPDDDQYCDRSYDPDL